MCLVFSWYLGSLATANATVLSQKIITGSKAVLTISKCCRKLLNQTASCVAAEQVTYSSSIVDKATQDCFSLLHSIALSLSKKTYLEVDLARSMSPPN